MKSVLGSNIRLANPPDALNRRLTFQISKFEVYCTSEELQSMIVSFLQRCVEYVL
jgi:hypothetical protein